MVSFKDFLKKTAERQTRRNVPDALALCKEVAKILRQVDSRLGDRRLTTMRTKPIDERKAEMRTFVGRARALEILEPPFLTTEEALTYARRLIAKVKAAGYTGELHPAVQLSTFTHHYRLTRQETADRRSPPPRRKYLARIIVVAVDKSEGPE